MNELDTFARSYEALHQEWSKLKSLVRHNEFHKFTTHATSTDNVLEIGIGDGVFTSILAKHFKKVLAVDGSRVIIDRVKKKLSDIENIEYICSFIEELTPNQKIDNIVMSHILEHVNNPVSVLKKIKSFMHKDTILYISVPNAKSIHRQVAVKMGLLQNETDLNETDIKLGHKIVYTPDRFKSDVLSAGLDIVEFGGSMLKPLTNKQIEEGWTEDMIRGFIAIGDDYPELCGDIYIVAKIPQGQEE